MKQQVLIKTDLGKFGTYGRSSNNTKKKCKANYKHIFTQRNFRFGERLGPDCLGQALW